MILQQIIDGIKTENDIDVQTEQDSTGAHMVGVHVPSTFSVRGAESEVSCLVLLFKLLHSVVWCYGGPLVSDGDVIVLCERDSVYELTL
jgi:hypothetical protein